MLTSMLQDGGSSSFMPHGMCYLWEPELLILHVAADTLTWLSYWAIPPALIYLAIRARRQAARMGDESGGLPHEWIFWAFGIFIVACGATHLMAVWTVWNPNYWASGGVKVVTALASVTTAVALPPMVPRILHVVREARLSTRRGTLLAERNHELVGLNARLRDAERARTRFFADVSHELRTPLTLVLGPVDELLEDESIAPGHRSLLHSVRRSARGLQDRVNELLELARTEEMGRPVYRGRIDVAELVRSTARTFEGLARSKEIHSEVETPQQLVVDIDRARVERILTNLLSNAYKHVPDMGVVRCTLETVESDARIVVEDSGLGIPAEDRSSIFERYQRGSTAVPHQTGSGLGLSIVEDLVTSLGGTVEVDDSDLGGARFIVRVPLSDAPGLPTPGATVHQETETPVAVGEGMDPEGGGSTSPAISPGNAEGTVLVAEDDPELGNYLVRTLGEHYRVYLARNGVEAIEIALRVGPDLIVTDLMMPRMGGEELLREVTRHDSIADTAVIVLTARTEADLPARLLEAGAVDYLVKPVQAAELRARVRNVLALRRTRSVLASGPEDAAEPLQELAREVVQSHRRLQRTVQEKQVAVRELHHRVKGNLQTISSLLSLQMRTLDDEGGQRALREAQGRVATMALVHERLYAGRDPDHLAIRGYLRSLASMTVHAHVGEDAPILVDVSAPAITLPAERAISLGLLVHELLANALIHGFPDGMAGRIDIELTQHPPDLHLRITDTGVGIPNERRGGLGLDLVSVLTRQLEGRMEIETGEGSSVHIHLPMEDA